MKRLLLIVLPLLLIVGCSKSLDETTLIGKYGKMYSPDSDGPFPDPYTGEVFINYDTGEKLYQGTYENGVRTKFEYYDRDGTKRIPINFNVVLDNRENTYYTKDTNEPYYGEVFSLYSNGNKKITGEIKNGYFDGNFESYHENGHIHLNGNFEKGEKVDEWTWYDENKNKIEVWSFKRPGHNYLLLPVIDNFKTFHNNGNVEIVGSYNRTLRFGFWKLYDSEGSLLKENGYSSGRDGNYIREYNFNVWKGYNKNGNLIHHHEYEDEGENKGRIKSISCGVSTECNHRDYINDPIGYTGNIERYSGLKIRHSIPEIGI